MLQHLIVKMKVINGKPRIKHSFLDVKITEKQLNSD